MDFADLNLGMAMIHLFTFDPEWLTVRHGAGGLVLYDGVCGLCDRTVQFLLDVDRHHVLRFAPLQGETAKSLLGYRQAIKKNLESIIFVREYSSRNAVTYVRSEAVLRILNEVGGFWRVVSWLRIIPRPFRDMVYDWIGRNRYQWFGKFAECRIPSAEVRARFLP
ncbi:MAG: DCC1-like thiol-disulfide oxidoreductase family protein [Acidobacteria bacterium]|nr:DCC1-like thiol-disulfide oxidoreductase family protein [Acidobacteriota bacterium]